LYLRVVSPQNKRLILSH